VPCSKSNTKNGDEKTISIAVGIENYNFKPLFEEFTAKTGIAVEQLVFDNNDLKSQLLQKANAAALPDVVIMPSDYLGLEQLNFSTVPNDWIDQRVNEKAKRSVYINGHHEGIPFIFGNHLMLYYNKKWVKSAPQTWDDILRLANRIPKSKSVISWNYLEMYWYITFYNKYEQAVIVNNKANLNTPEMVASIDLYKKLRQDVGMSTDCNYTCMTSGFESGATVMSINGTWIFDKWKSLLGDDLGLVTLPSIDGKPLRPYYAPHVLAFPNNGIKGEKKPSLQKLSLFMQTEAVQVKLWQQLKTLPVRNDVLEKLMQTEPDIKLLMSGLQHAIPMPNDPAMAYIWEALLKGITRYEAGIVTSSQAADYMQYIANKSISNAKQKHSH
jgi:maltose-binding protein MalE